jgi:predicted aminopeptidase
MARTASPICSTPRARPRLAARVVRAALAGLCLLVLAGCADTQYYWQSVGGHLRLMRAARPVANWLDDPQVTQSLKQRLRLSQRVRDFAVAELALPDNASYRNYADLHRPSVVWNVVAAPELSLTLNTWCFPVLGCVTYRGYFDEAAARQEAAQLAARGLEVSVYGVPAYSTLGWMNWAGGDPLLNTFIQYPEGELARLLFHELAHQVLYARNDTQFNESFATTVERIGRARWLQKHGSDAARAEVAALEARRRDFRALLLATRAQLEQVYRNADARDRDAQRRRKQQVMRVFRDRYAALKAEWGGYAGYDTWVANANNASLGAQTAYDELVPQFEALFERQGGDWKAFYHAVRQLAELPAAERRDALARAGRTP